MASTKSTGRGTSSYKARAAASAKARAKYAVSKKAATARETYAKKSGSSATSTYKSSSGKIVVITTTPTGETTTKTVEPTSRQLSTQLQRQTISQQTQLKATKEQPTVTQPQTLKQQLKTDTTGTAFDSKDPFKLKDKQTQSRAFDKGVEDIKLPESGETKYTKSSAQLAYEKQAAESPTFFQKIKQAGRRTFNLPPVETVTEKGLLQRTEERLTGGYGRTSKEEFEGQQIQTSNLVAEKISKRESAALQRRIDRITTKTIEESEKVKEVKELEQQRVGIVATQYQKQYGLETGRANELIEATILGTAEPKTTSERMFVEKLTPRVKLAGERINKMAGREIKLVAPQIQEQTLEAQKRAEEKYRTSILPTLKQQGLTDYKDIKITEKATDYAEKSGLSVKTAKEQLVEDSRLKKATVGGLFAAPLAGAGAVAVGLVLGGVAAPGVAIQLGEKTAGEGKTVFQDKELVTKATTAGITAEKEYIRGKYKDEFLKESGNVFSAPTYKEKVVSSVKAAKSGIQFGLSYPLGVLGAYRGLTGSGEAYEEGVRETLIQEGKKGEELDISTGAIARQRKFLIGGETTALLSIAASTELTSQRLFTQRFLSTTSGLGKKQFTKLVGRELVVPGAYEAAYSYTATQTAQYDKPTTSGLLFSGAAGGFTAKILGGKIIGGKIFDKTVKEKVTTKGASVLGYTLDPAEYVADVGVGATQKIRQFLGEETISPATTVDDIAGNKVVYTTAMKTSKVKPFRLRPYTVTPTAAITPSLSYTATPSITLSQSLTQSTTLTPTTTFTTTPTITPTTTTTLTQTLTPTPTPTVTPTITPTVTPIVTPTTTTTTTPTVTPTTTPTFQTMPFVPFALGKGKKGLTTGKKKREYGYTAGFAARLLGITAEKAPEPKGGFFTGQEIRPIITGKKPKTKKVPKKKKSKKKLAKKKKKKTTKLEKELIYNPF